MGPASPRLTCRPREEGWEGAAARAVGAGGSGWGIWVSTIVSAGDAPQVRFPPPGQVSSPDYVPHLALSLLGVFLCLVGGAWVKWASYVPKIYEKLLSFDSIKNAVGNTAHFLDVSKYWL